MAGILVEHARFVEVQQRRAHVAAELSQLRRTPASPTQPAAIDEPLVVAERLTPDVDVKTGRRAVDPFYVGTTGTDPRPTGDVH